MKKQSESDPEPDTSNWLTRYQVVQVAGIGMSTLISYEKRGLLHPRRVYRQDTRGAERSFRVYDPDEVLKLPRRERVSMGRSAGETTAQAFELFREGKTHEEVVIELRETLERVEELHEKWMYATNASRVLGAAAWEALERLVGPFASVTDLVDKLQARLKPLDAGPDPIATRAQTPSPSDASGNEERAPRVEAER